MKKINLIKTIVDRVEADLDVEEYASNVDCLLSNLFTEVTFEKTDEVTKDTYNIISQIILFAGDGALPGGSRADYIASHACHGVENEGLNVVSITQNLKDIITEGIDEYAVNRSEEFENLNKIKVS